jgi:hypothetical protein
VARGFVCFDGHSMRSGVAAGIKSPALRYKALRAISTTNNTN